MDAFFKLLKTSPVAGNQIPPPEYDDEDAFFDLELNYENKLTKTKCYESDEDDEEPFENSPKTSGSRSPISFMKSPPKFALFFKFRKAKIAGAGYESPSPGTPVYNRTNSEGKKGQGPKEVIFKYMRMMRVTIPGANSKGISSENVFLTSSAMRKVAEDRQGMRSPSLMIMFRRSGKRRSAVPASGARSPGGDLVLQSDAIQSAILHCKRSYNSSVDLSVLSRSVSETAISINPSRFSIEEKNRISI